MITYYLLFKFKCPTGKTVVFVDMSSGTKDQSKNAGLPFEDEYILENTYMEKPFPRLHSLLFLASQIQKVHLKASSAASFTTLLDAS